VRWRSTPLGVGSAHPEQTDRRARADGSAPPDPSPPREGIVMLLAEFGTGQVFWSMLWFFLFFIWIWLLITVFGDIFRSSDLSGWGKALWTLFVIFLPYLGVFVYLIARGHKMQAHAAEQASRQNAMMQQYIQDAAGSGKSSADEIASLADLHSKGVLSDAEFQAAKAKALAS
jgi:hypothetical protein